MITMITIKDEEDSRSDNIPPLGLFPVRSIICTNITLH